MSMKCTNKYKKALDRIKVVIPQDNWTQDDIEHYLTICDALEKAMVWYEQEKKEDVKK